MDCNTITHTHGQVYLVGYEGLEKHVGHSIIIRDYDVAGPSMQIECETCNEALYSVWKEGGPE